MYDRETRSLVVCTAIENIINMIEIRKIDSSVAFCKLRSRSMKTSMKTIHTTKDVKYRQ